MCGDWENIDSYGEYKRSSYKRKSETLQKIGKG